MNDWSQAWLAVSTAVLSSLTAYNAYSPMEIRVQVNFADCVCLDAVHEGYFEVVFSQVGSFGSTPRFAANLTRVLVSKEPEKLTHFP
jgi:hypothetical protein